MGYVLVLLSLFSYGTLGVCHKLAERKHCRPKVLAMMVMLAAFFGMNLFVLSTRRGYAMPPSAFYVAIICGSIALGALWAFQEGIRRGKIATSWLVINLSSIIPTVGSILIYHEPVSLKKILIVVLIFIAIVLIWKDALEDLHKLELHLAGDAASSSGTQRDVMIEREM